jgi:hypothetical protein
MDRSFLLQKEVIEASRDFICIRLATYEDQEEVAYLTQVFLGREGTLENTVFAMLSPEATKYLAWPGRGPQHSFVDAGEMATQMRSFAAAYRPASAPAALPAMKDFRLALGVASADNMPLVVAVSNDTAEKKAWSGKLADLAWSRELLGSAEFAPPSTTAEVAAAKIPVKPGLYVIEPDTYGQTGRVLARIEGEGSELVTNLRGALARFKPQVKEARSHISTGSRTGVYWKTATPVTDPNGPPGGRRD